jgi:hypothetical protein
MNISSALTVGVIAADCLWVFATGVAVYADLFTPGGDFLLLAWQMSCWSWRFFSLWACVE